LLVGGGNYEILECKRGWGGSRLQIDLVVTGRDQRRWYTNKKKGGMANLGKERGIEKAEKLIGEGNGSNEPLKGVEFGGWSKEIGGQGKD